MQAALEIPVTVCVAALSEFGGVVGASDRMITAGDVEFEPGQGKIWEFTTSIAVMTAGDSALQTEILLEIYRDVPKRIETDYVERAMGTGFRRTAPALASVTSGVSRSTTRT